MRQKAILCASLPGVIEPLAGAVHWRTLSSPAALPVAIIVSSITGSKTLVLRVRP
jgi:hypothetical protein